MKGNKEIAFLPPYKGESEAGIEVAVHQGIAIHDGDYGPPWDLQLQWELQLLVQRFGDRG